MPSRLNRRHALAALGALALPLHAAPAPAKPSAITVPPLPLVQRVLPNGLSVSAIPARTSATVAVQVWMRVGG